MADRETNYKIGVTSGMYGIAKAQELLGLTQKISSAATTGANYIQVDFENTSEFMEPDVMDRIKQTVNDLKIQWGSHGEINQAMAWETSIEVLWRQSQRKLHQYLDAIYDNFHKGDKLEKYGKLKPEYINFHTSYIHPIGILVERYRYQGQLQMTPMGKEDWSDIINSNRELKDWFCRTLLRIIFVAETGRAFMTSKEIINFIIVNMLGGERDHAGNSRRQDLLEEKIKKAQTGDKEKDEQSRKEIIIRDQEEFERELKMYTEKYDHGFGEPSVVEKVHDHMFEMWKRFSKLRNSTGSITREEFAYAIIAKYLEVNKDNPKEPLWNLFFKGKSMDEMYSKWSASSSRKVELWDETRALVTLMPEVTAMVASRYIIGHFQETQLPESMIHKASRLNEEEEKDPFYSKTALEKINILKVKITFENPDVIEAQSEGLQRLMHVKDIHKLIKAFNNPYVLGWIDIEHYLHNGLDPIEEFNQCEDGALENFLGLHVGNPKTYAPGHDLIDVGSEAQRWIYVYSWHMKQKGFGMGKNKGIIIFERGGGRGGGTMPGHFIGNTVTAIRLITDELDKDTPPEKLPMEFFGVSPEGFHSEQKQIEIMHEHYWDPLKGMLAVPEEEYTFLSRTAFDKGKRGEEFKRAELR